MLDYDIQQMERTKLEVFLHILLLNIVLLLLMFAVLRHLTVQCMTGSMQFTACTWTHSVQAYNIMVVQGVVTLATCTYNKQLLMKLVTLVVF